MLHNILAIAGAGIVALAVAALFYVFRGKGYGGFGNYWNAEGIAIWMIVWVLSLAWGGSW